jgi:hypothetical protein
MPQSWTALTILAAMSLGARLEPISSDARPDTADLLDPHEAQQLRNLARLAEESSGDGSAARADD